MTRSTEPTADDLSELAWLRARVAELERERDERLAAQEALRFSEERFRLLAENIPGVIYLCRNDARYTMLYLNDEVERLTGYPKAKFLADQISFVELYHPEDAPTIGPLVENALAERRPFNLLYRLRHRDGQWRWVNEVGVGVFRGDELRYLEGFISDITERTEVERRLLDSEAQGYQLFEIIRDGLVVLDPEGTIVDFNSAYHQMHHMTRDELAARTMYEIVHSSSHHLFEQFREQLIAGESFRCEAMNVRKDGTPFHIEVLGSPFPYRGEPHLLALVRDISEQKEAQERLRRANVELESRVEARTRELRESEQRMRTLIDNLPGVIYRCVWNDGWTTQFVSDEVEALSGYPPSDMIGRSVRAVSAHIHEDDRETVGRRIEAAVATGRPFDLEYRLRHRAGDVRWVYEKGQVLLDETGGVVALEGAMFDVTAHRRAQLEVDRVFGLSLELLCIATQAGFFKRVNPAFMRVLGYSEYELLTTPFMDWVHPDDRDATLNELAKLNRGEPTIHFENRYQCKDGSWRRLSWIALPVMEEGLIYAAARDVTALREADERVHRMESEVAHVARLSTMGELATSLAHEMNQPLYAMCNYLQGCILRLESGTIEPEPLVDTLRQIVSQAERAGQIIKRMRSFARKRPMTTAPLDLNDVVRQVATLISPEARRRDVVLKFELADELPAVLADRVQIEQVIVNLVRNGIESIVIAAPAKRRITVRTHAESASDVAFDVADTGGGVPDHARSQLFMPFFTTKDDGLGMGLSISKSIIEAHGGRLALVKNTATGATFRVMLRALQQ